MVTSYVYDFNGNVKSILETDAQIATSSRTTQYRYDRLNRIDQVLTPPPGLGILQIAGEQRDVSTGGYFTNLTYDNLGNVVRTVDPLGNATIYTFDLLNRPTNTMYPDGSTSQASYTAMGSGWLIKLTDALNRKTSVRTDFRGNTLSMAGDSVSQYTSYWADGLIRSSSDDFGNATDYEYNNSGMLQRVLQPATTVGGIDRPSTQLEYRSDGLLSSVTDPLGRKVTSSYDAGGRRIRQTQPASETTGPSSLNYDFWEWDSIGNLVRSGSSLNDPTVSVVTNSNQPKRFLRDSRFQLVTAFDERGAQDQYEYDNFGRVTALVDSKLNRTTFGYNRLDQLIEDTQVVTSVTPNQNLTRSFVYDAVGNLRRRTDRNGRDVEYSYDTMYSPTSEVWKTGATIQKTIGSS